MQFSSTEVRIGKRGSPRTKDLVCNLCIAAVRGRRRATWHGEGRRQRSSFTALLSISVIGQKNDVLHSIDDVEVDGSQSNLVVGTRMTPGDCPWPAPNVKTAN